MGLSELELADRSGCSPETVRRFVDLGVLGRGAELQLANTALFSRIRELESTSEGRQRLGAEMGTQVMDLSEPLLLWLRRRHLEHEIYSFIVPWS